MLILSKLFTENADLKYKKPSFNLSLVSSVATLNLGKKIFKTFTSPLNEATENLGTVPGF